KETGTQGRRARPDRSADGEAHRPRAQGRRAASRHVARRPARRRGAPCPRRQGRLRAANPGPDCRIAPGLRPGPDLGAQPSPQGGAVTPAEILAGLESFTIAKFGHAVHVAAAWVALRLQPFAAAPALISAALH